MNKRNVCSSTPCHFNPLKFFIKIFNYFFPQAKNGLHNSLFATFIIPPYYVPFLGEQHIFFPLNWQSLFFSKMPPRKGRENLLFVLWLAILVLITYYPTFWLAFLWIRCECLVLMRKKYEEMFVLKC